MSLLFKSLAVFLVMLWALGPLAAFAEDAGGGAEEEVATNAKIEEAEEKDVKEDVLPTTTADPTIPVDELDILVAPLTVDELKVEADGWRTLVKGAAEKVAEAKLRIKRKDKQQAEADAKAGQAEEQIEAGPPGGQVVEEARTEAEVQGGDERIEAAREETASSPRDQPVAAEGQAVAEAHQADPAQGTAGSTSLDQLATEKTQAEAEAQQADEGKDEALEDLTALREERTALIDRLDVILANINQKIGLDEDGKEKPEVLKYRRYIDAVGGIKLDVSDTETAIAGILGWAASDEGGLRWAINIATFLLVIVSFWVLSRILRRATRKGLQLAGNQSKLLTDFLVGMIGRVVLIVGIIVGLAALEVNIGPLLAVIGAAGFVVAFALQDTLSNFASGIMIMFYRPFDVDDLVEVAGIVGTVRSLNLVSTTITTPDNKRMVVPNNEIWGNIITNATGTEERRVDMVFGIGYDDDIGKAKQVLESIVSEHPLVLDDPEPVIQLHELADSSVNFICRPWAKTGDYWTLYWDVTRSVKDRFDEEGISIPFPQRDVHFYHEQKQAAKLDSHADTGDTSGGGDQMGMEEDD